MQRVHQDDLVGYLQEQGGFEVLNLPAIAQRNETYELGGRPSLYTAEGRAPWRAFSVLQKSLSPELERPAEIGCARHQFRRYFPS